MTRFYSDLGGVELYMARMLSYTYIIGLPIRWYASRKVYAGEFFGVNGLSHAAQVFPVYNTTSMPVLMAVRYHRSLDKGLSNPG